MFAFGKNKELLRKLESYLQVVRESLTTLKEAIDYCLDNGLNEHFKTLAMRIHQHESHADDIRRSIEMEMFKKSLLPESRQDMLTILEMLDRIPNCAESIANMITIQKTIPCDCIKEELKEIISLSQETTEYVIEAAINCFGKADRITDLNHKVDSNETLGDRLERKMIGKIFDSKMDTGEKILQRDLVSLCGKICDLCEHSLDIIVITSVKRQV